MKIDVKLLLGAIEGGGIVGKLIPFKKDKLVGYLIGAASKTRFGEATPTFYMRLPEGKGIEEVLLLSLELKNGRREVDLGSPGPKQELKGEVMKDFDSVEAGPHLFKITTSKLLEGEYMFFLIASGDPPKGTYGKVYDFGIEEPPR